jgi:hypothetical protein
MNEDPYPQGVQTILDRQIDGTLPVQDPDSTPAKTFPNLLKGFVFKPDDETYYLNPDEQYAALASKAPVAGALTLATLRKDDGTQSEPVFIVVAAIGVSAKGEPLQFGDIDSSSIDLQNSSSLQDPNRGEETPIFPLTATTWASSRATAPSEAAQEFLHHQSAHLISLKGNKMFRPTIVPCLRAPDHIDEEWSAPLYLADPMKQIPWATRVDENTPYDQMNEIISANHGKLLPEEMIYIRHSSASNPSNGFWITPAAIPLPPGHGLPVGAFVPAASAPDSFQELLAELFRVPRDSQCTPLVQALEWLDCQLTNDWLSAAKQFQPKSIISFSSMRQLEQEKCPIRLTQPVDPASPPIRLTPELEDLLYFPTRTTQAHVHIDICIANAPTKPSAAKFEQYTKRAATYVNANSVFGEHANFRNPHALSLCLPGKILAQGLWIAILPPHGESPPECPSMATVPASERLQGYAIGHGT